MNICVGLRSIENIEKYIYAGATEFYCGVFDSHWLEKYGYIVGINRRPYPNSNISDFFELENVVKKVHKYNCKVFFTVNEHFYIDKQMDLIRSHITNAINCGVDAIIVSDISLVNYLSEIGGINIHISTGGTVFNSLTAQFYQKNRGVSRIIMPREVTVKEISEISKNMPTVEYEVFMLNEGCINIDGFCNHVHGLNYVADNGTFCNYKYSVGCMLKYTLKKGMIYGKEILQKGEIIYKINNASSRCGDCGLCAIYQFKDCGITSLKLVGRATNPEKVISDIKIIKNAIEISRKSIEFDEYSKILKREICQNELDNKFHYCYYPDLWRDLS